MYVHTLTWDLRRQTHLYLGVDRQEDSHVLGDGGAPDDKTCPQWP